jgi:hypothetical protein
MGLSDLLIQHPLQTHPSHPSMVTLRRSHRVFFNIGFSIRHSIVLPMCLLALILIGFGVHVKRDTQYLGCEINRASDSATTTKHPRQTSA